MQFKKNKGGEMSKIIQLRTEAEELVDLYVEIMDIDDKSEQVKRLTDLGIKMQKNYEQRNKKAIKILPL